MVRQEIYGYLLTHHAISALICRAATEADIDPDRVKFTRTVRIARRAPPEQRQRLHAEIMACITRAQALNPQRRHRTYPKVIKRARHNSYRVKRASDQDIRHTGPPTITLANLGHLNLAA
jgi:hypothetical protein